MATYGGESKRFPSNVYSGKQFYVIVDAKTGEATYYEDKGPFPSVKLGSIKPGEKFEPTAQLGAVFNPEQRRKFLSDENQKKLKQEAKKAAIDGQKAAGVDEAVATKRANELLDTGEATTPPNADPETVIRERNNSLSQLDITAASGTRRGAGSFGGLRYPKAINRTQDFIKFTMLEYKAKRVGSGTGGTGFGFGSRTRVGPSGEAGDRTILGSASLPIPGGIRDENGANWGGKTMNELQIQGSELARALTGASGEGAGNVAEKIVDRLGINDGEVKTALQESFAANAVGAQGLLARTRGAILNPNLELLFESPTLRPFSFTFDLAPRNEDEANEVIKIIRFFKQGSAPIRSESNLFLLAPHTFQVHYILGGDDSAEHPFIGRMKECAITKVQVDYTPQQNYSTLKGGYMTSYKLTLQMTELEPIFNDDYNKIDTISSGAFGREGPLAPNQIDDAAGIGF